AIASKIGLVTAEKKDSQGLCFIGKVKLPDFLQQQLQPKEGVIVEIPEDKNFYHQTEPHFDSSLEKLQYLAQKRDYSVSDGKVVGTHQGAHYFTKGQRKGLAVGGTPEPLFVIDTDVEENIIYTGQGKEHPGLLKKALFVKEEEIHWIREDMALNLDETMEVKARIRYRQPLQDTVLHKVDGGMFVEFEAFQ